MVQVNMESPSYTRIPVRVRIAKVFIPAARDMLIAAVGKVDIKGEDESYDFGSGAGFYVDAIAEPWSKNYKMYSYITSELPQAVSAEFGDKVDTSRISISGHSMGGHGALSLFLKNPGMYKSVSAFAPIANPLKAPWGEKAFKGYFGEKDWEKKGAEYDSTELIKKWKDHDLDILIDVVSSRSSYSYLVLYIDHGNLLGDR